MDHTQFPEERLALESPGGQRLFPDLGSNFEVLAPSTEDYNCIAYSLGSLSGWINPQTGPEEDPFGLMDVIYQVLGFARDKTVDWSLEPGKRKVALYATRKLDGGIERITHAAVQEADGNWISKLGQGPLIRHETPAALAGPVFGEPVAVYVREALLMELKEQFEELTRQWAEHCSQVRFSSILGDYLDHPAYRAIVQRGATVIPWIIEHYRTESLPWGFALQEITGVRIIADPNEFSPSDVRKRWLEWWEKQGGKSPLAAIPVGPDAGPVEAEPKR